MIYTISNSFFLTWHESNWLIFFQFKSRLRCCKEKSIVFKYNLASHFYYFNGTRVKLPMFTHRFSFREINKVQNSAGKNAHLFLQFWILLDNTKCKMGRFSGMAICQQILRAEYISHLHKNCCKWWNNLFNIIFILSIFFME